MAVDLFFLKKNLVSFDPNLMHIHKEMLTEDAKLIYLLNCYYFAAAAYSII